MAQGNAPASRWWKCLSSPIHSQYRLSREQRVAQAWDIEVGETIRRTELHKIYGGGQRGGMEPSGKTPNVLLFTSPAAGEQFGYKFDGWHEDGTFHFTGEGQYGDQVMTHGNRTTLEHSSAGRALRLFRKEDVFVTYMGEFEIPDDSYVFIDEAPDADKELRSVFVFRLKPVGVTLDAPDLLAPTPSRTSMIPVEAMNVDSYVKQRPDEPAEALRREADLVKRYVAWVGAEHGQELVRHKVPTPAGALMYTDLFNLSTEELIEAKASSSRHHIRSGLGQILDYARYVDHESLALLLPTRPAGEMVDLLKQHGVECIWETIQGAFVRTPPTPLPVPHVTTV